MFPKGIGHIIVETIIAFFVLFLITRIVGKKQLSQLTYFNYVTGIAVGSIAASMAVDKSISKWEGITSIVLWAILTWIAEWLTIKVNWLKKPLQSTPSILIRDGLINHKEMKKNHLNLEELTMLLRQKDTFSFGDVAIAVLETNGMLTVVKNSGNQAPTRNDLNLPPIPTVLAVPVIVDGKLNLKNLKEAGYEEEWLKKHLEGHDIQHYKQVFYAEIMPNGKLFIGKRDHS